MNSIQHERLLKLYKIFSVADVPVKRLYKMSSDY